MSKIMKLFRLGLLACSFVMLTGFVPSPQTGSQPGGCKSILLRWIRRSSLGESVCLGDRRSRQACRR